MPYKSEKMKIAGTKHDRRRKLTDEQREQIVALYKRGEVGCLALARRFGVSKRLIQFIVNPEKWEADRKRKRNGRKPSNEERAATMREYRHRKQQLYLDGKLEQ